MTQDIGPEAAFRISQDRSPDGFMMFESVRDDGGEIVDFRWVYANPAAASMVGHPPEWFPGRLLLEEMPGNRDEGLFDIYKGVVESGEVQTREFDYDHDGISKSFRNVVTPVGDGFAVGFSDITARRAAERALLESDRKKDEFLALISHELRNPLAGIAHALETMQLDLDLTDTTERAYEIAVRQVGQLRRLIDDLLDVSRVQRGVVCMSIERMDLSDAVNLAIDNVRPRFDRQHIHVVKRVPREHVYVDGDLVRLSQAIGNLLDNACKFSPPGGRVELVVDTVGDEARLTIEDQGRGLDAIDIEGLFQKFVRGGSGRVGEGSGLGLGLYLVRELVEAQGGTVDASSPGKDQGATFEIRMPLRASAGSAAPSAGAGQRTAISPDGHPLRRILVVDDDEDAAESLAILLEAHGHQVERVETAGAALTRAAESRPDVVLLDIGLPDISGLDLARLLRRDAATAGLALVALSGFGRPSDIQASREAGIDEHLVKPVSFDRLMACIDLACAARD